LLARARMVSRAFNGVWLQMMGPSVQQVG